MYPALLLSAPLALAIIRILRGIARNRPVGFLVIMSIVVGIFFLRFLFRSAGRSRYGTRVLKKLRAGLPSRVNNQADPHLPLAFALFGMAALPLDGFADLKQILSSSTGDSGGGGDGGGDGGGGGGCGGGGCGG